MPICRSPQPDRPAAGQNAGVTVGSGEAGFPGAALFGPFEAVPNSRGDTFMVIFGRTRFWMSKRTAERLGAS